MVACHFHCCNYVIKTTFKGRGQGLGEIRGRLRDTNKKRPFPPINLFCVNKGIRFTKPSKLTWLMIHCFVIWQVQYWVSIYNSLLAGLPLLPLYNPSSTQWLNNINQITEFHGSNLPMASLYHGIKAKLLPVLPGALASSTSPTSPLSTGTLAPSVPATLDICFVLKHRPQCWCFICLDGTSLLAFILSFRSF